MARFNDPIESALDAWRKLPQSERHAFIPGVSFAIVIFLVYYFKR